MNLLALTATLIFSQLSLAQLHCYGEAQFIAQVAHSTPLEKESCRVHISFSSIKMFREHQICPLSENEVIEQGFIVNHCFFKAGSEISGILVKDKDGQIFLD